MEEEKMLVPSGLKTVDGKDIMCYTGAFYIKNEEKIKRIIKKCEEILDAEDKKQRGERKYYDECSENNKQGDKKNKEEREEKKE